MTIDRLLMSNSSKGNWSRWGPNANAVPSILPDSVRFRPGPSRAGPPWRTDAHFVPASLAVRGRMISTYSWGFSGSRRT